MVCYVVHEMHSSRGLGFLCAITHLAHVLTTNYCMVKYYKYNYDNNNKNK